MSVTLLPDTHRAACADHPPDAFFAQRGGDREIAHAVGICAGCPIRPACRDWWAAQPRHLRDRSVIAGGWYWPENSGDVRPFPGDRPVIGGVTEVVEDYYGHRHLTTVRDGARDDG